MCQCVVGLVLLQPQQVGRVAVERGVSVRVLEQVQQRPAERLQRPGWAPVGFDDVQTNLSGAEVDVGVEEFGFEVHFGGHDRVLGGEADLD